MANIIDAIEKEAIRTDLPEIRIGDTVKVFVKVVEGTRE
ncbi:MAG: 50S ribosomal protein L19, partial [Clostridia bacterium]|nr:50S ribosomal protein L19 [Clostridia bacterium]